jgi:hypothetical protein
MARWIYQRPLDCCNPTELAVAKRLARLAGMGDSLGFLLPNRSGRGLFNSRTDRRGTCARGQGGKLRRLSTTGRWEGPGSDRPLAQIDRNLIVDRGDLAAFRNGRGAGCSQSAINRSPRKSEQLSWVPLPKASRLRGSNISSQRPIGSSYGTRLQSIRFWTYSVITGNL